MKYTIHIFALLVALIFAVRVQAQTLTPLKAGDPVTIELKVPAEDAQNVSTRMTISGQGTIKVAYLDREIQASGLTTTDLARRIEAAYKANEIYTNPTINVTTTTPQDMIPHIVSVGGEVRSPQGQVALRDGMRLYQAIMSCGGPTEFADMKRIKIIRGTRQFVIDMKKLLQDGSNNPLLQDGDTIHVPTD